MSMFNQYRSKFLKHPETWVESTKSGTEVFVGVGNYHSSVRIHMCGCESYIFNALEINMFYRNVCILYINVYIQYLHIYLHTHTTGTVIHYIGWGCQSPNPQEIHCFKCKFCVWLCKIIEERNPGVKQDLLVY
jgi:hypothetical protein